MADNRKNRGLLKKAIAVTLGITMAFGTLMLPDSFIRNSFTTASAATIEVNGCKFTYAIETDRDVKTLTLTGVEEHGETVEIPETIIHNDVEYPVHRIDNNFLKDDETVKTVIFPDSVKYIAMCTLSNSSVENIVLPDGLEHISLLFASNCQHLKSVEYHGTGIKRGEMGNNIFMGSDISQITNEKGAVCLGNWLIKYKPDDTITSVKIADLGNNGVKIENMAYGALRENSSISTVDLEGIKVIDELNFSSMENLVKVLNSDDVETVGYTTFGGTPWRKNAKQNDLVKIGKTILYYKTDSKVLDLTSGELAGTMNVNRDALNECTELETVYCSSDCNFDTSCFYVAQEQPNNDDISDELPVISTYKIKDIYIDGKKLTYSLLNEDPKVYAWLKTNYKTLKGSQFAKDLTIEKTKAIFKQMDIPYYGFGNKKFDMHTPTEEFYIRLKIHNYLSQFDYDHHGYYKGFVGCFLLGGQVTCQGYADLTHYLLESAGVECKSLYWDPKDPDNADRHVWNSTRIGDEWFENDDGWDAQNNSHSNSWFMRSSTGLFTSEPHKYDFAYDSYDIYPNVEARTKRVIAARTLGDLNTDNVRNQEDVDLLWSFINSDSYAVDDKAADINFDGNIDVTDAVLLDNLVNSKALDMNNIYYDGMAPTVKIAFLNKDDYENIQYLYTDREGYITLPEDLFAVPEGKKLKYDIGKAGQKVRITKPYTVVQVKFVDINAPDYILGDVNDDGSIDIEDAVAIIQHINGVTALDTEQELRANVSKDKKIDIDDAVTLISYINGNSTF